jgi:hypothetical protein
LQTFDEFGWREYLGHGAILEDFHYHFTVVTDRELQQHTTFDWYRFLIFMPALVFYKFCRSRGEKNFGRIEWFSLKGHS